jgi:hypothetical protein
MRILSYARNRIYKTGDRVRASESAPRKPFGICAQQGSVSTVLWPKQAQGPSLDPDEMGMIVAACVAYR